MSPLRPVPGARRGRIQRRYLIALCVAGIPALLAALLVPVARKARIATGRSADK